MEVWAKGRLLMESKRGKICPFWGCQPTRTTNWDSFTGWPIDRIEQVDRVCGDWCQLFDTKTLDCRLATERRV